LDESVNLGEISTSSFGTPLSVKGALDLNHSPITLPRSTEKDDESGDKRDVTPPSSPLDDKALLDSKEADVDVAPQRTPRRNRTPTPRRDQTPTPKRDPEPQTPSRRPKIQITVETESIAVSSRIRPSYRAG
jgi:hypothetical protein